MKKSVWFCLGAAVVFVGCGGTTRLGTTGEDRGANDSGGASTDGGSRRGDGGAGTGGIRSTGGRFATGGRAAGGRFGTGGGAATGGRFSGGAGGGADASIGGGVDGSVGTGRRPFDAGDDPLRNRVPAGKSADRLTTIMCAAEEHCCPKSDRSFGACKQAMMASIAALDRWATFPELGYDIDRAEAAFSEFEKRASACDTGILPWMISNAGFRAVASGTVQPGASCLSSDGGTNPDPDAAAQAARLASCALPEVNACMFQSPTNWVCAPRSDTGGPCVTDMNCLDGLYCQGIYRLSTCALRVPNGESCTTQSMCASLNCDVANSRCVPGTLESVYCLPYVS